MGTCCLLGTVQSLRAPYTLVIGSCWPSNPMAPLLGLLKNTLGMLWKAKGDFFFFFKALKPTSVQLLKGRVLAEKMGAILPLPTCL